MNIKSKIQELGKNAKVAARSLALISSEAKNEALQILSKNINNSYKTILEANQKDIEKAKKNNLKEQMINRLA